MSRLSVLELLAARAAAEKELFIRSTKHELTGESLKELLMNAGVDENQADKLGAELEMVRLKNR